MAALFNVDTDLFLLFSGNTFKVFMYNFFGFTDGLDSRCKYPGQNVPKTKNGALKIGG